MGYQPGRSAVPDDERDRACRIGSGAVAEDQRGPELVRRTEATGADQMIDKNFSHYRIIEKLGQGVGEEVYKAEGQRRNEFLPSLK